MQDNTNVILDLVPHQRVLSFLGNRILITPKVFNPCNGNPESTMTVVEGRNAKKYKNIIFALRLKCFKIGEMYADFVCITHKY